MRSRLEPMEKVAKMLRRHKPLLMVRRRRSLCKGAALGLNLNAKRGSKNVGVKVSRFSPRGFRIPLQTFTHGPVSEYLGRGRTGHNLREGLPTNQACSVHGPIQREESP